MKRFPLGELRFDEKELKRDAKELEKMGPGNFIFVGSSCDMWAESIPGEWIAEWLGICYRYPENKYLFQSKNPERFIIAQDWFSPNMQLATTIETNRDYKISNAPSVFVRASTMSRFINNVITIEPILDFDLKGMINLIQFANPKWVNIGADSKRHNLPEPNWEKVQDLISALKHFTEVKEKSNLSRLKK